jgi:hypothetical protein
MAKTKQEPVLALDVLAEAINEAEREFRRSDAFRLGMAAAVLEPTFAKALLDEYNADENQDKRTKQAWMYNFKLLMVRSMAAEAEGRQFPVIKMGGTDDSNTQDG